MYSNSGLFVRRRPPPSKTQKKLVWAVITMLTALAIAMYVKHLVGRLLGVKRPLENARLRHGQDSTEVAADEDPHLSDAYFGQLPDRNLSDEDLQAYEEELLRQAKEAGFDEMEEAHGHNVAQQEGADRPKTGSISVGEGPSKPIVDATTDGASQQFTQTKQRAGQKQKPDVVAPPLPAAVSKPAAAAPAVALAAAPPPPTRKALIFTMDSITDYVRNSKAGGPAGEIIVRESLEWGLRQMGVEPVVATSDAEFATLSSSPEQYSLFFLDPWTFVNPGWTPRPFLIGREDRSFMLAFFGARSASHGWAIGTNHILTPYPVTELNSFLGYAMPQRWLPAAASDEAVAAARASSWGGAEPARLPAKKRQGVLWGKKPEYFAGKEGLIAKIAALAPLHSTASGLGDMQGVVTHGHLSREEWHTLLAESKFLLGMGDPLSGPSALDAVAAGAVFINPHYAEPKLEFFASQHPFLEASAGQQRVCAVRLEDEESVLKCVQAALDAPDLDPFIPPEMTRDAYLERARGMFGPLLKDSG